jgi:hypothetical protein
MNNELEDLIGSLSCLGFIQGQLCKRISKCKSDSKLDKKLRLNLSLLTTRIGECISYIRSILNNEPIIKIPIPYRKWIDWYYNESNK